MRRIKVVKLQKLGSRQVSGNCLNSMRELRWKATLKPDVTAELPDGIRKWSDAV